jgi:iron complex outermembrane recepter protein
MTFAQADSVKVLNEIIVTGYNSYRSLAEVPAAIHVIDAKALNRFNNTSFVPVVNTLPGVRMEERSPGSYRFSIRGSLLRSPFGVRNVKFYWNGLPLTDGGGNTYLNLLDVEAINKMEVIKGPGASLYGAGTGGVVLLSSMHGGSEPKLKYSVLTGSYGLFRMQGSGNVLATDRHSVNIKAAYQRADGYRDHTEMKRYTSQIDWNVRVGSSGLFSSTLFTTNLFYETPGGLTYEQFESDPKQARPATAVFPGATEQRASVKNNTTYWAAKYEHEWRANWKTDLGVFASYTSFKNPAIRNYEKREELNLGGRLEIQYRFTSGATQGKFITGIEYQTFHSPVSVFDNLQGTVGALQVRDKLGSISGLAFAQFDIDLPHSIYLTAGMGSTLLKYSFLRTSDSPATRQFRNFEPGFFPRLALLKKFGTTFSVFGSVSSGFSPPSVAEVRPSTSTFNNSLNPEEGIMIESGVRGTAFKEQLRFDVVAYDFKLQQTIVIQRDAGGAEYFINAGETRQRGLESMISFSPVLSGTRADFNLWVSYALSDYFFHQYVQDGVNYSGNQLTGIARNMLSIGMDVDLRKGLYKRTTLAYTDRLPLNDANSEFAPQVWLAGIRLGYRNDSGKFRYDVFATVDNLFNQRYSLGHDLNAAGGRYYNAAPEINASLGLKISL